MPSVVLREVLELLGRLRTRLQGLKVPVIRAEELGQHSRVERVALGRTRPKPIPSPVQRLGIHGVDHDAMVKQEIHDPALGPLNRRPQLDPLGSPFVELATPFAQARRRVRHRPASHLRPLLIHNPDRMRLIGPVDAQVVAHSTPLVWSHRALHRESVNGKVRLIPALLGATFS